jgi:hypothetical protein
MTFDELIKRMDPDGRGIWLGELRDLLLYNCQYCLKPLHEHAQGELDKCLFGPTEFKGFPRRAIDSFNRYYASNSHLARRNFLRRKAI